MIKYITYSDDSIIVVGYLSFTDLSEQINVIDFSRKC